MEEHIDWTELAGNAVQSDDLFADTWDVETEPVLTGQLVNARLIRLDDTTSPDGYRDQLLLEVHSSDGRQLAVWANADLRQLLNAYRVQVTDFVYLEYLGERDLGEGRRVKKFKAAVADYNTGKPKTAVMGQTSSALPQPGKDKPELDKTLPPDSPASASYPGPPEPPDVPDPGGAHDGQDSQDVPF